MPLSWTEIRDRAVQFQKRWKDDTSEQAESQSFWTEFFNVYGVDRKRVGTFEKKVSLKRAKSVKNGRIDLFWPGKLLIEMKSAGQDLDRAFDQATDYFDALPERDLPRYILVCNFNRFRLYDLEERVDHPEFTLDQLEKRIKLFGFIAGYNVQTIKPQDPINIKAAERMGKLHDALEASGYTGHPLEVLLVRLLFCLFADDTGIFTPTASFREWIENETKEDGSDLGRALNELFEILNTPHSSRLAVQKEKYEAFEYVNGQLFSETLRTPEFNGRTRELLLDACALDWSTISPAIFGALFQSIMNDAERRKIGAHYTSEENILKLIKPLFLDELRDEFERSKGNRNKLFELQKKLRTLTFLDPACGCGNFLVIAYRELRLLELDILRAANKGPGSRLIDIHTELSINVDQFYGIEIEEFPAQIAQVAMWLTDHQMNRLVSDEFGAYFARIPLKSTAEIRHANALRIDWNDVLPAERCNYVLGNPPFIGHHLQSDEQKSLLRETLENVDAAGVMDFVTAWFYVAANYIKNSKIEVAFVATNSITQGEQVGIFWLPLRLKFGVQINFAHRTFRWSNEGRGVASVYCVAIGFASFHRKQKFLYDYETPTSQPVKISVSNINAYLVDAPDVFLENRRRPIHAVPEMMYGSKPTDDGNFLFADAEKVEFLATEPNAAKFIRPFLSAREYLHGERRWVLWLAEAAPGEINAMPAVKQRVVAVDRFRKSSKAATTRSYPYPYLFRQVTQPKSSFVLIPGHTSENRKYIPFGFFEVDWIVGNSCFSLADSTMFHFGVIQSNMHMVWVSYTCGRIKSDYRYSKDIVYNNFPWPDSLTRPAGTLSPREREAVDAIEAAAQGVLDARAAHPESSLADLYDPLTMPLDLLKAHQKLDAAVDAAYYLSHAADGAKKTWKSDAERVAFLFTLYQKFTSLLPTDAPKNAKRTRKTVGGE
jgi:hypothetical protein